MLLPGDVPGLLGSGAMVPIGRPLPVRAVQSGEVVSWPGEEGEPGDERRAHRHVVHLLARPGGLEVNWTGWTPGKGRVPTTAPGEEDTLRHMVLVCHVKISYPSLANEFHYTFSPRVH